MNVQTERRIDGRRERRFLSRSPEISEGRSSYQGAIVKGYAALFDSPTLIGGAYLEIIEPGAFDKVLNDDVRALFNHDDNLILARTKSRTLMIGVDRLGLWYEFEAPDTSYARDLVASLRRGDVDQSSFAFYVGLSKWTVENGKDTRRIQSFSALFDVSPVTYPATSTTTAGVKFEGSRARTPTDILRKRLELAALECGGSPSGSSLANARRRLELAALE